jgi:DNA-binding transcriptional LysR family regulator
VNMAMSDRMVDLVEDSIDLAITTMPVPNSNLVMRRVGSFRLLVCGSPDYLAQHGTPREPDDLINHNCMKYTYSTWGSEWRFKSPDGQRAIQVTGNMESNSVNSLRLAASLGQGLILLPDFLVKGDLKSGKLVQVLADFCTPDMAINAVYPHRQHLATNVRSFLDLVAKHFHAADLDPAPDELELPAALIAAQDGRGRANLAAIFQQN